MLYLFGDRFKVDFYRANQILVFLGILVIPVVFYEFYTKGQPAPIWGGPFEVGDLYLLFSLGSLSLYLHTKRKVYLIMFFIFLGMVFFSMRRSAYIATFICLLLALWMMRHKLSKKHIFFIFATFFLGLSLTTAVLVKKDDRFKAVYEGCKR